MQEEREQQAPEAVSEEATSSETLKDIEETEKVSDDAGASSGGNATSSPSPDGAFDEGRGGDNPM